MTACARGVPDRCASTFRQRLIISLSWRVSWRTTTSRALAATFDPQVHKAAAVITYFIPGLRFFHQGQFESRKIRISPHLVRAPEETPDKDVHEFYDHLLAILKKTIVKNGEWHQQPCHPAWDGNGSWDSFISHAWQSPEGERMLVAVNFAPHSSQCYIQLPFPEIKNKKVRLQDQLSTASYLREGNELFDRGLYLDLEPWSYHVFTLEETI